MARKGENIYLRKDGRWEGRYIRGRKTDGKPIFQSIYGRKYIEVKERLVRLKGELSRPDGELVLFGRGTFAEWSEYWLEILVKPFIKESTYAGYRRTLEKHLLTSLGSRRITAIHPADIQAIVNQLQESLAPGTLHGIFRLLKSILRDAQRRRLILFNPCENIRLPRYSQRSPRYLTSKEQQRLEAAARQSGQLEYIVCLYTGLRLGELCGLTWEDVSFTDNLLRINKTVQRVTNQGGLSKTRLIMQRPKTAYSVREIPVPAFIMKLLQKRFEESKKELSGFVFPSSRKTDSKERCMDPHTVQEKFKQLLQKARVERAHMHTLRHTFATRCLETGMGYETLAYIMGHSSPQITLRCYAHCTVETARRAVNKLKASIEYFSK